VLSELICDDLQIAQFQADAFAVFSPGIYLTGNYVYGGILDGDNQDSDFAGDNRTLEFSRSTADASDDYVEDVTLGGGFRFRILESKAGARAHLIPLAGYSFHEQNIRFTDADQIIPPLGPFTGLRSEYETQWEGPWVGGRAIFELPGRIELFATGEYHWAEYEADAFWSLRFDFAQPISFEHEADGTGVVISLGANWFPEFLNRTGKDGDGKGRWYVRVRGDWQSWETDPGIDRVFFFDGSVAETRLNEVNWDSWAVNFGLGFRY